MIRQFKKRSRIPESRDKRISNESYTRCPSEAEHLKKVIIRRSYNTKRQTIWQSHLTVKAKLTPVYYTAFALQEHSNALYFLITLPVDTYRDYGYVQVCMYVCICVCMYIHIYVKHSIMYTSLFYQYLTYFSISVSVLYGGLRDKLFRNENCELPVLVVHSERTDLSWVPSNTSTVVYFGYACTNWERSWKKWRYILERR